MNSLNVSMELIIRCLSNKREAQRELYDVLLAYLNVVCKRYLKNESDLKDVLQDTFINIFNNLHQYDLAKASFKTWATKIAINNSLKKNVKNERIPTQGLVIELHASFIQPKALNDLFEKDLLQWLKTMPTQYFEVFNMYIIDGFSHAEIAEILKIDESLSRKRLSRSRAWLKKSYPNDVKPFFKMILN